MDETRVVILTAENIGRVERWRVDRQGTLNFLHAHLDGDWYQVVVTRSDPACVPPRALRMRPGEFTWRPRRLPSESPRRRSWGRGRPGRDQANRWGTGSGGRRG